MKFLSLKYFLSTIVFAASVSMMNGQDLANSNWHFGDGVGLFHDGSNLVSTASSIATMNGVAPASISNDNGDLMFYSNGQSVWNADHEVIDNGTFGSLGLNNIFCPVPGNPDQYYLFRSAEWGVDYSIVDATLNGGEGAIVEGEKEIFIQNHKSELLIAHKAGTFNFWLLVIENSTGGSNTINIQSYEVSDTEVSLEQTFNAWYFYMGWYNEVDDAKLSPDCSKIAVLHKGHYLTLYEFDNTDGTVFNNLPDAIDTQTSYVTRCNMEFAPGSEYIYIIGDFNRIDRYSLNIWTEAAIAASQTTIAQIIFGTVWRDIKLGPFGDLYVYNEADGTIESVIDPDVQGNETGLEYANMDIETTSYFFPNTPNLSCNSEASLSFLAEGVCLGDTTWLSFEMNLAVDDLNWDFGGDEAIFATTDNNPNWVIYPDQGTYNVTLELFFNGIWHEYEFPVSVGEEPQVDLGSDVTLCQGESVTFSVPNEELYQINWSTGAESAEIEVATSGVYGVVVNNLGCIAGDTVAVDVIPQIVQQLPDIGQCADEQAVLLDAENSATENYLWSNGSQEPNIEVNTTGTYWVQMSNECFTVVDSSEVLLVDFPEALLPEDLTICEDESVVLSVAYQGGGEIEWSNGQSGGSIEVSEPGTYSVVIDHVGCIAEDTIHVSETPALNVSLQDYVFCDDGQAVLDATHPAAENYLWSNGSTDPSITVSSAAVYWVELSNNCFSATDTSVVEIVVFPDPLLPRDVQACVGDTVFLNSAYQSGTFFWNNGEVTSEIAVTESGVYTVFIEDQGCTASGEAVVDFQDYYPLDELEMPNVFTPNSDRDNPVFRPYSPENRELQLCGTSWFDADITIYNRWGVEIHKDVCFWDGKSRSGETMHDGTYFYLVDLSIRCYQRDENRQLTGYVTLLR